MPSVEEAELYAGAQRLVESDKAFTGEGRVRFGALGIGGRFTQFREPADNMTTLTLDLWSIGASYRIRAGQRLTIEPELGVAGLRFAGDGEMPLAQLGASFGATARVEVAPGLAFVGTARYFAMGDLTTAIEGRAGIAAGPLQLSYRRVKLDTGPALEGPEVGVGLRF